MEAALRKPSAQQLDVQPMLSARQVAYGDAEKPKVFLPPVSPPSTVQVPRLIGVQMHRIVMIFLFFSQLRLGDVKKRLDSKLSELMNVQVPSSTKAVTEQQVKRGTIVFICGPTAAACVAMPALQCILYFSFKYAQKNQFFSRPLAPPPLLKLIDDTCRLPTPSSSTLFAAACLTSARRVPPTACHRFNTQTAKAAPPPLPRFFRAFRLSSR
jgi:hypothetical protein